MASDRGQEITSGGREHPQHPASDHNKPPVPMTGMAKNRHRCLRSAQETNYIPPTDPDGPKGS
jgi:hypothetical protein